MPTNPANAPTLHLLLHHPLLHLFHLQMHQQTIQLCGNEAKTTNDESIIQVYNTTVT